MNVGLVCLETEQAIIPSGALSPLVQGETVTTSLGIEELKLNRRVSSPGMAINGKCRMYNRHPWITVVAVVTFEVPQEVCGVKLDFKAATFVFNEGEWWDDNIIL